MGSRSELIMSLFRALDETRRGALKSTDILRFARRCGFDGRGWEAQFQEARARYGWGTSICDRQFAQLVDDEASGGYCTGQELRVLLVAHGCRPAMAWELLQALDQEGRGQLSQERLRPLAGRLLGRSWAGAPWQRQWKEICRLAGAEEAGGLDLAGLLLLLDGGRGSALGCDSGELHGLLQEAKAQPELVFAIFQALDKDGDGRLGAEDLGHFADLCGIDDGEGPGGWAGQYHELCCGEGRWSRGRCPSAGASLQQFSRLFTAEDGSPRCAGEDLRRVLMGASRARAPAKPGGAARSGAE